MPAERGEGVPREPRINDEFPIQEGELQLSPPIVSSPIYECAEAVHVSGFIPHATVKVFVNLTEVVGEAIPSFGFAQIDLVRPLAVDESITAMQAVGAAVSRHSIQPVLVSLGIELTKPVVGEELYECGEVVPVGSLVPGMRVHVYQQDPGAGSEPVEIGAKPTDETREDVHTQPLQANQQVTAQQVSCEHDPARVAKSPWSEPVPVMPVPDPMPPPIVDEEALIVGNDAVVLSNLLVGATVRIFDRGKPVSGGAIATAPAGFCGIDPPLRSDSVITATQELCGHLAESDSADPHSELRAPVVVGPICGGSQFVTIRDTVINANVSVFRNNEIVGYGGALADDLVLGLGGDVHLAAGDVVEALQYMGATISPMSKAVIVAVPGMEMEGGEPFFVANAAEEQIDGPVFPRGRGEGPVFKVQACCSEDVRMKVFGPDGSLVFEPQLVESSSGYFVGGWGWQSVQGWGVPAGIPVGEYAAVVSTGCSQDEARGKFYVIFNPDDVGGPPRFSFNDTAIWFTNSGLPDMMFASPYHLHPADGRVFSRAVAAANGISDPEAAAEKIARAEEKLFSYTISYGGVDVLTLLEDLGRQVQCADDASLLTALLRAVGIPAHPVTADAAMETGNSNWHYDTWTEFLVPAPGGSEWKVFHPHQYPNQGPWSRQGFGTDPNLNVAQWQADDLIIMANENWSLTPEAAIWFIRNTCGRPEQIVTKKEWIDELCEKYWEKPHWDCGEHGLEPPVVSRDGYRLVDPELVFGEALSGSFSAMNRGDVSVAGELAIELVSHFSRSKGFPEETFDVVSTEVTLDAGQDVSVPFELRIPSTLRAGRSLYLRAQFGGRTLALRPVPVPSAIETELHLPRELHTGDRFEINATVRNVSDRTVRTTEFMLEVPYAIRAEGVGKQPTQDLAPRAQRSYTWTAEAIAPMEAGIVELAVTGREGGSSLSTILVTVAGTRSTRTARPLPRPMAIGPPVSPS
jgi:hypothetical protein